MGAKQNGAAARAACERRFLIVDDDAVDVMSVQRAFARCRVENGLAIARDGVEALELLRSTSTRERLEKPYVILLDLNMPRMNGIEFLRELRADPDHRDAVVFVMTTSRDETDKRAAYEFNVAGYIVKSHVSREFLEVVTLLERYWRVVELPGS